MNLSYQWATKSFVLTNLLWLSIGVDLDEVDCVFVGGAIFATEFFLWNHNMEHKKTLGM